jgi:two-component sensor histidine kinase
MNNRIINIIASPFFLALILFAIVYIFIPDDLFQKNKIDLVSRDMVGNNEYIFYENLDMDGTSEKIRRYIDKDGMNALNVYLFDGTIIDQFNFRRNTKLTHLLYALDRDNNGLKEIYDLSHSNDSIFLNWVEPLNESGNIPQSIFVTTMPYNRYGNIDYSSISFRIADLNKDGNNELLFTVNGGYSKFPRKVFAYDFKNDTLFSSPFTGAKCHLSEIRDINNDGYNEIILFTAANANIHPNDTILDDEHSYLMVLDHNLNFLFEPAPFFGYPSSIHVFAEKSDNKWILYGLFTLTGKNGESQKLFQYDVNGNEIMHIEQPGKRTIIKKNKTDSSTYILFNKENSKIRLFDIGLNEKNSINNNYHLGTQLDLDGDGNYEWVGYNLEDYQTIFIFTHDFSHCTTTEIPVSGHYKYCFKFSNIENSERGLFHVQKDEYNFIYKYHKNNFYYFKFPFYIGIYLFLLLIVFIIQKLQRYQTERKIAIEKQISELQLKTIRSQMDPHFTFNALNTISSIIYREDKEKAHRYFTKFSKLVRATLEASDKITRTLNEELDFTENYLMLEKIRFKDKFEYEIKLAENVNKEILIPKMIIQIYVENAIKHGLKHKEKDGLLKIDISQSKSTLKIIIEDNGIGREKAAKLETFGTGHGMKIMETIGKLYFKLYKTEIRQKVEDLFDERGNAAGTRVVVEILKKEELN